MPSLIMLIDAIDDCHEDVVSRCLRLRLELRRVNRCAWTLRDRRVDMQWDQPRRCIPWCHWSHERHLKRNISVAFLLFKSHETRLVPVEPMIRRAVGLHGFMASSFQNSYAVGALDTHRPVPQEISMREFLRPVVASLSVALLAASLVAIGADTARAQAKDAPQAAEGQPPVLKQIALTDKQIDAVLASQKDMDVITDKLPENAQPDPKIIAQLEAVAKKHGFASYDDYNNVVDNISLVLGGIDPATKKYVGSEAVIKSQILLVEADKTMNANEKKQALENLNMALKAKEPPIENKANIDLVLKYYDKLAALLGEDTN